MPTLGVLGTHTPERPLAPTQDSGFIRFSAVDHGWLLGQAQGSGSLSAPGKCSQDHKRERECQLFTPQPHLKY